MTAAFLFPGQGSQSVNMQTELAESHSIVRATYEEASDALGFDLWKLTRVGPSEELNQTQNTQPAVLCAGVAAWRVWCSQSDARPHAMAGHSLGEYTALACADSIAFVDAVKLVADRGRFMQDAVPEGAGAMAVVLGLEDAVVREVCEAAADGQVLQAVNYNSPGQVAIAGNGDAVQRAIALAKERGARRAMALAVSVPSHCDLMRPAAEELQERLKAVVIAAPGIPVINNVDVASEQVPEVIRDALVRQLYRPVRWVETVQRLVSDGATTLIECGPGKVLTGLTRRIDKSVTSIAIENDDNISAARQALETVGEQ